MRIVNRRKFIHAICILTLGLAILIGAIVGLVMLFTRPKEEKIAKQEDTQQTTQVAASTGPNEAILSQWNLMLVNKENSVDPNYVPELEEISDGRMFDKRAISYVKDLINAMWKNGIRNVWVQSSYRSYEKQKELFDNKVQEYIEQGKKQEEAERLAQTVVQRPEMSEHNLGLAVDFNTVTNSFETTKAFEWLQKNAWEYGFILRYPKDKVDITGITYESWHWRYVGKEHAKVIKEKGFCLEEYVDYLKGATNV